MPIVLAIVVYTCRQRSSLQKPEPDVGPFFEEDPYLSPDEHAMVSGVIQMLVKHQKQFSFDPILDQFSSRKLAYEQTAAAASDFFATGK